MRRDVSGDNQPSDNIWSSKILLSEPTRQPCHTKGKVKLESLEEENWPILYGKHASRHSR